MNIQIETIIAEFADKIQQVVNNESAKAQIDLVKNLGIIENLENVVTTTTLELDQLKLLYADAQAELAANIAYQQEALSRAAAAIESGDQSQLQAVLSFAGASFAEKERQKKLEKAAQLKAEAAALELDV